MHEINFTPNNVWLAKHGATLLWGSGVKCGLSVWEKLNYFVLLHNVREKESAKRVVNMEFGPCSVPWSVGRSTKATPRQSLACQKEEWFKSQVTSSLLYTPVNNVKLFVFVFPCQLWSEEWELKSFCVCMEISILIRKFLLYSPQL